MPLQSVRVVSSLAGFGAILLAAGALLPFGSGVRATESAEDVVVYECARAAAPPTVDGVLDDEAWRVAAVSAIPYKFLAQTPELATSRSTVQLAYDSDCLYLAAVFYRDSKEPLKRNHLGRDDPDLWMDDSTEIYFDPESSGRFFKFIVSAAGVVTDFRQTDAGIDYTWNADGAKVAAKADEEKWTVEMSVPWVDFGLKLPEGQVWSFEILRFSGKSWASWTVGAAYARPEKFGYVCFGGGFFAKLEELLSVARRAKGDRWRLVSRHGVLDYSSGPVALELAISSAARKLGEARLYARSVPDEKSRTAIQEKLRTLQDEMDKVLEECSPPAGLDEQKLKQALTRLAAIAGKAGNLSYECMIQEMLK